MSDRPEGVLLMAYGSPPSMDEVAAYYTHIRRGRPPTEEQLADLIRRYDAIGGASPLWDRTRAQAAGVQAVLDAVRPGGYLVALGCKHAPPFIEDGVAELARAGVERAAAVVLAPHYSALSVGEYQERAVEAATAAGMAMSGVDSWHLAPGLIEALSERLAEAVEAAGRPRDDTEVLVTAHSLPARVLETGDPYPDQLRQTGEAVTEAAGVTRWRLAWQSAGRTPGPWLGPDVLEVIGQVASEGAGAVVVCPAGFTSDHLEVLYDLDVDARRVAEERGLAFARTRSLNDDPRLCRVVAEAAVAALAGAGAR
ncbi:MAG TPA: ferrochelatase [Acidimicrobiales bacterium]|nr:ferrochelatase [Acidimicrobiales bacterium]